MILDNLLITDRPKQLLDIQFYTELPGLPVEFNYGSLPTFLNFDLMTLSGIMPKTNDLIEHTQPGFHLQPSQKEVEYYRKRKTKFQIIQVVANIHTFKKVSEELVTAHPYSISLIAGPKRGVPDLCSIDLLNRLDLEQISQQNYLYTDFSPFKSFETSLFTDSSFFVGGAHKHFTDTVGFVLESYFLPTDTDLDDVPMAGPQDLDPFLIEKYNKYRIKRYYKPFKNLRPRKIWGCDSPIELFLIQALAQRNLFPIIQTLIFKNGHIFDNFFEMVKNKVFIKGDELITEPDLYFPESKLAIFCDSKQFHRGKKSENKDDRIDKALTDLGIRPLRITGKEILNDLDGCVNRITNQL